MLVRGILQNDLSKSVWEVRGYTDADMSFDPCCFTIAGYFKVLCALGSQPAIFGTHQYL